MLPFRARMVQKASVRLFWRLRPWMEADQPSSRLGAGDQRSESRAVPLALPLASPRPGMGLGEGEARAAPLATYEASTWSGNFSMAGRCQGSGREGRRGRTRAVPATGMASATANGDGE